ncbi:MAG: 2-phospho-L-lactate transferase [Chloroflexi bacterium]|nr:2-phospho-L-lactate transferase [Chloroflexota bacterium]
MRVVELAGGVGGAKLAFGLQAILDADLTVVVNTGDDTDRHGLRVCPDLDTVTYTLAGLDDRTRGWGLRDETWTVAGQLARLGEETWFQLGDRDLATHIVRTARLRAGARLTDVAVAVARSLGVRATVLPMSDDDVRTEVRTDDGWLEFQEYFVHRRQEPVVHEVRFVGVDRAEAPARVRGELGFAEGIVIAPSNPVVSIAPILAVRGMRDLLAGARRGGVPIVALSPIVGGSALKGPADRMLASLGHESSALGVARLYADVASGFVLDTEDADLAPAIERVGLRTFVAPTVMTDDPSRIALGRTVLEAIHALRADG